MGPAPGSENSRIPTSPRRFQDARDFAQSVFIIHQIAEAKGRGHQIEAGVGKRELKRVCRGENGGTRMFGGFFSRAAEHRLREIATDQRKTEGAGIAQFVNADAFEREGEVAGAAAEIEDARVRSAQDMAEFARGAAAPVAVQRKGEEVIQEIVARSDAAEHIAHSRGGFTFVERASRPRAGQLRRPFHRRSHAIQGL